jgi:hypothetical protein
MFSLFDSLVNKFISKLVQHEMGGRTSDEQDSKKQEFFGIWKSCVDSANVTVSWSDGEPEPVYAGPVEKPKKKSVAKKTKAKSDDEEEEMVVGKCTYVATKGSSKGKVCGKKAVSGKKMCASHKKAEEDSSSLSDEKVVDSEDDNTVESTPAPAGKTCVYTPSRGKSKGVACGCATVDDTDLCAKHSKKAVETTSADEAKTEAAKTETKVHVVKKMNGRWVHVESGFVFKSNKERVVVGKMVDDTCEPITDDDLPELERYSFEHEVSTN